MVYRSLYTFQVFLLLVVFCIAGCQSVRHKGEAVDAKAMLHDEIFPSFDNYTIETPQSLFWLSDDAKGFVDNAIVDSKSEKRQMRGLVRSIFNRAEFDLLYQADANTDANTTFKNRAANCLSLTIMTYAMAQHAGFNAHLQQIDIPEFWTRREGFTLLNAHVNLRIVPQYSIGRYHLNRRDLIIDFDPQEGMDSFGSQQLSQARVVAMFYNNKAAELILDDELNHAYAYLRAAIHIDPAYEQAMMNLGIVYRYAGAMEYAENAYLAAIALDPDYLTAWGNLAALYEQTQREAQASAIYSRLEKLRMSNPYYHLMLGEQAFENEDFKQSIGHFKEAIRLDDYPHHFYFALAQAHLQLGNIDNAERYLSFAKRKAGKARIAVDYSKKLSIIAGLQNQNSPP